MKQSELHADRAYNNGAKGKWNQDRTITKIDGHLVSYKVTAGRNKGHNGSMTKVGFAQWAEKEIPTV